MTALIWHDPLRPEDVMQACRDNGVVLTYVPEADLMCISGEVSNIACIIADILRTRPQLERFMDYMNILDSSGTPRCSAGSE